MQSKNAANMPQTMGSGIVKTPYPIKFPLKTRNKGGLLPAYIGGHPLQLNNQATNIGKGPGTYTTVEGKNFGQVTAPIKQATMPFRTYNPDAPPKASEPSPPTRRIRIPETTGMIQVPVSGVALDPKWLLWDRLRGWWSGGGVMEPAIRLEEDASGSAIVNRLEAMYHVRRAINDRLAKVSQDIQRIQKELEAETNPNKKVILQNDLTALQQTSASLQAAQKRGRELLFELDRLEAAARLEGGKAWESDRQAKRGYLLEIGERIKRNFGINVFDLYTALKGGPEGVQTAINTLTAGIFEPGSNVPSAPLTRELASTASKQYDHVVRLRNLVRNPPADITNDQLATIQKNLNNYAKNVVSVSHFGDISRLTALQQAEARAIASYKGYYFDKFFSGGRIDETKTEAKPIVPTGAGAQAEAQAGGAVTMPPELGVTSASRFASILNDFVDTQWRSVSEKLDPGHTLRYNDTLTQLKKQTMEMANKLKEDYLLLAYYEKSTDPNAPAIVTAVKEDIVNTLKQLGQTQVSKENISAENLSNPENIKNLLSYVNNYSQQLALQNLPEASQHLFAEGSRLADTVIKKYQVTDNQGRVLAWTAANPIPLSPEAKQRAAKFVETPKPPEAPAIEVGTQGPPVDINWWRKHMGFYRDEQFRTFQDVYKDPVLKGMYKFDQRIAHLTQLEQDLNAAIANVQATGGYGGALYKRLTDRLQTVRNQLANEINRAQKDKFKLDTIRQTLAAQAPGGKPDESLVQQLFIKYKMAEDWQNMQANAERARELLQSAYRYTADSAFTPERVAQRWKERWMNEFYQRGMGTTPEALAAFQRDVEDIANGRVTPATLMEQIKTVQPAPQPAPQPVAQPTTQTAVQPAAQSVVQSQQAPAAGTPPAGVQESKEKPSTPPSETSSGFGPFGPSYGPFTPTQSTSTRYKLPPVQPKVPLPQQKGVKIDVLSPESMKE